MTDDIMQQYVHYIQYPKKPLKGTWDELHQALIRANLTETQALEIANRVPLHDGRTVADVQTITNPSLCIEVAIAIASSEFAVEYCAALANSTPSFWDRITGKRSSIASINAFGRIVPAIYGVQEWADMEIRRRVTEMVQQI